MTDQELHSYSEAWYQWCKTRRYFIAPGAKNLLARMQPRKIQEPPDATLSREMSYFNMAIHALADMNDGDAECFVKFYFHRVRNIKAVAANLGIHRDTFYERKRRFARKAFSMALSLKRVSEESKLTQDDDIAGID